MPGRKPHKIVLYRIVHIDNVEYLLTHGMFTKNHPNADPNYINIGDCGLIAQRNDYPVGINPPNGFLGEYVPFYFGPLSPMLLNIKTGHRGITYRPQSEIAYICCNIRDVIDECSEWCFTNGHAKNAITEFFNDQVYLDEIDWGLVSERYWSNTEDDYDRMRRKQAEFLVKNYVPVNCIDSIVVYNAQKESFVKQIVDRLGLEITIKINPGNQFYY